MNKISSMATIIICTLITLTLTFESALTQSQLSPPEFTLNFILSYYNRTETNPYTGVTVTEQVENSTVEVWIKNQLSGPRYYNVRVKGHFEEEWDELFFYRNFSFSAEFKPSLLLGPANSGYTVFSYSTKNLPEGAQLDFAVKTVVMYNAQIRVHEGLWDWNGHLEAGLALGESSEWSDPQTITKHVPSPSPSPSPSPTFEPTLEPTQTPSPTVDGNETWDCTPMVLVVAVVVAVAVVLAVYFRKRKIS